MAKTQYNQIGVIWKGRANKNGEQMADSLELNQEFKDRLVSPTVQQRTVNFLSTISKVEGKELEEAVNKLLTGLQSQLFNKEAWVQVHTKDFKKTDLEQKIAKGWLTEENAEKARYTVSRMSDKVYAEIIEIVKNEN